ncbi:MAG TPA: hypothetical protein DDW65_19360 [Firmicutes bacterium]|jgi:hypothetical protein|nr:hypothetical protein [Bacillota bacterium]
MNKIQLMLDVVKTMKAKESLQGTFNAEAKKDQVKIFSVDNQFARNTVTGATKVKINTDYDYDGNQVKHESNTEFNLKDFQPGMHAGFHEHMRMHRQMHCQPGESGAFSFPGHSGIHSCGFKGGLSRISLLLHVLNNIALEEKPDQSFVLSLNRTDLPEEFKQLMQERMNQPEVRQAFEHEAHGFLKELHMVESPALTVNMIITKKYEVEKIKLEFSGNQKDENNADHLLTMETELNFIW